MKLARMEKCVSEVPDTSNLFLRAKQYRKQIFYILPSVTNHSSAPGADVGHRYHHQLI